jgi:DNA-binding NtrC family response regulator
LTFARVYPRVIGVSLQEDQTASAQEVLVLDAEIGVLKAAESVLREAGLSVTALASIESARDQVLNRFFLVVLCDLDTPSLEGAIDFIRFVRDRSPLTAVIAMSRRTSFDVVASAFRAGAADVIPENRNSVIALRERVLKAARDVQSALGRDQLLAEFADANDELVRKLMELSGRATELEDKLLARDTDASSSASRLGAIHLLVVDDQPELVVALEKALPAEQGWRLQHAQSGGEALDSATQTPPKVLVAKELLPDLTGSMVVKAIKATAPGVVAMLFVPPADGHEGEIKMVDQSRLHTLIPRFASPSDLVAQLCEVRNALVRKTRERRYVKIFQTQYLDILQRCHRLRQQLDALSNEKK